MTREQAIKEAEKFRIHAFNIALATKAGRESDLKLATEMMLEAIVSTLTSAERAP